MHTALHMDKLRFIRTHFAFTMYVSFLVYAFSVFLSTSCRDCDDNDNHTVCQKKSVSVIAAVEERQHYTPVTCTTKPVLHTVQKIFRMHRDDTVFFSIHFVCMFKYVLSVSVTNICTLKTGHNTEHWRQCFLSSNVSWRKQHELPLFLGDVSVLGKMSQERWATSLMEITTKIDQTSPSYSHVPWDEGQYKSSRT